jgi:hypothetical protein
MNFKKIDLNNSNINKYKSKHKGLSHIRTGKDYKGYIYIDKQDNVVGFINMRISDKYIQAIEVSPEYQGKGLGKTLLNELIKMGATRLSVNKKNTKAKKMYDKLFKVEKEDEHMYYMVLEVLDYLKESRNLSIINSFSFKDITNSNIILTENFNIIGENTVAVNNIDITDITKTGILMEADDDLGPTDYNSDDLGGADDTGGDEDLGPTDYNEDSGDDTTTDDTGDDSDDLDTDDGGDDDLDSLESDTDDPTTEPSDDNGEGTEDVENSNDEQMNNDDQNNDNNENNKFLIRDFLELYNRLDEILEKINSSEKFKFSRDVVYNKARLNIEKIRDMLFDYITQRFNKESYVANLYHFNLVIQAININIAMIEKSPTMAEINERNKEKEAKSKKNEKTKRSK